MAGPRHQGLIDKLRRELALFVQVCLLILAVPLVYPLAQAVASGDGAEIICTHKGSAVLAGDAEPAFHALDDCPCGVLCPMHGGVAPPLRENALSEPSTITADTIRVQNTQARAPPPLWLRPPGRAPPSNA